MIPQKLIDALTETVFWPRLAMDPELQVVVRDGNLSVLYGSRNFIERIQLREDRIRCLIRRRDIPFRPSSFCDALPIAWNFVDLHVDPQGGLVLSDRPEFVDLGKADGEYLEAYKKALRIRRRWSILDELEMSLGAEPANRIITRDFHLSSIFNCRDFYMILRGSEAKATPVSIIDVARYRFDSERHAESFAKEFKMITKRQDSILKDLNETLAVRQELGAAHNLANFTDPITLLSERPICAVGDCTEADIEQINDRTGPWKWIAECGIEEHCEIVPYWRTLQLT